VLAAVVALAIAACGGGGGARTDAAADTSAGEDAAADTGGAACDPATQNCAAGSKCDFGCQASNAVVACRAENGDGGIGAACSAAMPCTRGSGCLTAEDAGVACRKYCAGDGDCPAGQRCHNVSVAITCSGSSAPLALHYCY
jgi:hypothetical protein